LAAFNAFCKAAVDMPDIIELSPYPCRKSTFDACIARAAERA
jgi:hypothetical protein